MPPRRRKGSGNDPGSIPARQNSQADRDFIDSNKENFKVVDGQLVYTGNPLDFGYTFQLPPDEHRCTQIAPIRDGEGGSIVDESGAAIGRRCPKWGLRMAHGRTLHLCMDHVPRGADGVRTAVRDMMLNASLALAGRMIDDALSDGTAAKDAGQLIKDILDRVGIRGGIEISADTRGWQLVLSDMMGGSGGNGEEPTDR